MDFNFAYNKPNSFFKDKKANVNQDLFNGNEETIKKDSIVTIYGKSRGLKVFFDIVSETGIQINNVSYEALVIIKNQ